VCTWFLHTIVVRLMVMRGKITRISTRTPYTITRPRRSDINMGTGGTITMASGMGMTTTVTQLIRQTLSTKPNTAS